MPASPALPSSLLSASVCGCVSLLPAPAPQEVYLSIFPPHQQIWPRGEISFITKVPRAALCEPAQLLLRNRSDPPKPRRLKESRQPSNPPPLVGQARARVRKSETSQDAREAWKGLIPGNVFVRCAAPSLGRGLSGCLSPLQTKVVVNFRTCF